MPEQQRENSSRRNTRGARPQCRTGRGSAVILDREHGLVWRYLPHGPRRAWRAPHGVKA